MSDRDKYVPTEAATWYRQNPEDAWKSLMDLEEVSQSDNLVREQRAAYNASMLEGIGLGGFGAWGYGRASRGQALVGSGPESTRAPLIWNYAAAGLDTLQAKVVGTSEPKPMLQVTDGDWDDHRQAVWSGRLLEGLYRQQQGQYHDVWDMARHAFKIAAGVTGTVAVKVLPYPNENKIMCELHDTLDMFVDYFECTYSSPMTFGESTWFDAHRLMAMYPKYKEMIWNSREPLPEKYGGSDESKRQRYMVKVVEGWRLTMGDDTGKYLITTKNGPLDWLDYEHDTAPFAMLHARRSLAGFWGTPVMERGMRIVERINQILHSLDKSERLVPKNMLIYDIGKTPTELMKNIKDVMQVGYNSDGAPGASPPQYITPQIYDQTVMNLLESHINAFHETLGINSSQMAATKDPGVTAAVAIRTVQDLFTQLFSVVSRDWTKFVTTDIGGLYLRGINDVKEQDKNFFVNWDGGSFMRQVNTSVADLDKSRFTIQAMPVSETRNTPADRMSLADEMLSRGELSPQAYQRIIATGDVPAETIGQDTQHQMIAKAMDSWMYDELEDITNVSPLPWMNLGDAIVQVLGGYMKALMKENFDPKRELYFRRYITILDNMIKKQAITKAQLSGASGGSQASTAALGPGEGTLPPPGM
jgi:hypothetical protein